ncbi:MAG: type II toxin-antitoxin system HicB family antitoxin [Hyphomicrobiales bacterium]
MNRIDYAIIVEPLAAEDGGGFIATVPDLPGCISDGETPQEALANVEEAIRAWIEAAKDLGHDVPPPTRRFAMTA